MRSHIGSTLLAFCANLFLVYVLYGLCRLAFLCYNWDVFSPTWTQNNLVRMWEGTWRFDCSAILYTNALYALLMLLPLHQKESVLWQKTSKYVFVFVNAIAILVNMVDVVYFKYTGRRTTLTVFQEFSNEGNLLKIFVQDLWIHWYVFLPALLLVALLWMGYVQPRCFNTSQPYQPTNKKAYYCLHMLCFLIFIPLCVAGMRGGFTTAIRPITIGNANQYVERPAEAALVLNTPFALIRTADKKAFVSPNYYTHTELTAIYTPIHWPRSTAPMHKKNVVVLILESFGTEYSGRLNKHLGGGKYEGYMPFLDSLMSVSTTWQYSFSNGRKSIDGMPSVLSSIPKFVESFFVTSSTLNDLGGLARELGREGYETAFFHGAENASMGFQAFAKATGFQRYLGRTEYNNDQDFDGTWGIWDEPFLQFYAREISKMKAPFLSTVFTLSSHHPYNVPKHLTAKFPEEGSQPLHKCVRYTDYALRKFFETARQSDWYKNTIFILTADHTSLSTFPEYQTPLGVFRVPIVFFDPSGELKAECRPGIAKQIDIMPTLLGHLRYPHPYVAFGNDLTTIDAQENYQVAESNGTYLFVQGNYVLTFDGQQTTGVYQFPDDRLMQHNLRGKVPQQASMERKLKAVIQSYMERMVSNRLIYDNENNSATKLAR